MPFLEENVDVVVVGAGHAGCEAALACARLGLETVIFTVSVDSIALMPCNPNIGGSSKGHLVRELDALGGEMGKVIDCTFIQSKMLNVSKGPAVHSLRAQADKAEYSRAMRQVLENTDHLSIVQGEVTEIMVENGAVTGVRLYSGAIYHARAAILCTGTYLKARCIYGDVSNYTGPNGLQAANYLTDSLKKLGIEMFRFKTGTPARIDSRSIDYSKMEEQFGDKRVVPFSFTTDPESVQIEQASCWLTYTNEKTHEIIRNNLDRSPLYSGAIEGTGPRYCPSIEDKVVRFADKNRHQVFIEPEGLYTNEMYVGGMSSSLPEDVQHEMYHSVAGLEHAKIVKNASKQTLYKYENNIITNIPSDKIEAAAKIGNVSPAYLMGWDDVSSEKPTILTSRDERDIKKDLDSIMGKLTSGEAGPAAYDGEELDPEAADLFREELEIALKRLKIVNKEKYTPKKYKK